MNALQHIFTSRLVALAAFAMVLVLTPRAWVEESTTQTVVPVQTLEPQEDNSYCLWCQTPSSETCKETPSKPRTWLNPDQPVGSLDLPCLDLGIAPDEDDPSS